MESKNKKLEVDKSLFFKPNSWFEPLNWEEVFGRPTANSPKPKAIHIDLGAGDGGFVLARAKNHPDTSFLAVERLLGRARKIVRRTSREGLENLRVLRVEARYAVEYLFQPHSISSMTILFPDPWPKRRHQGNRLIQKPFLEQCARCLAPDGWIGIKTDDEAYFAQILKALDDCQGLKRWQDADSKILLPETTDFEHDFLKAGRSIYFVAARLG